MNKIKEDIFDIPISINEMAGYTKKWNSIWWSPGVQGKANFSYIILFNWSNEVSYWILTKIYLRVLSKNTIIFKFKRFNSLAIYTA